MKSRLFKYAVLSALFFLNACVTTAPRTPAGSRGRHVVLTLHGVRGTEESFGHFHPIIKSHLEKVDPGYEIIPINFVYPTGQDNYEPNLITKDINARIMKELGGHLDAGDRISAIGYSMGGQVMAHWYLNTMFDPQNAQIAKQTENLIGLGAPFWGSNLAWVGKQNIPGLDRALPLGKMSDAEVKSLSPLGTTTSQLREKMIIWSKSPELRAQFKPKIMSIAGVLPCHGKVNPDEPGCGTFKDDFFVRSNELIKKFFFAGLVRWETDGAVIIPSARLDFLYYQDGLEKPRVVSADKFLDIQNQGLNSSFLVSETIHAGFEDKIEDVVIVEKSCWDPSQCKHSTYKNLFENLANCHAPGNSCIPEEYNKIITQLFPKRAALEGRAQSTLDERIVLGELQGFFVELSIKVPDHYRLSEELTPQNIYKYIRFNFERNKPAMGNLFGLTDPGVIPDKRVITGQDVEFQIGRNDEISSRMIRVMKDPKGNVTEIKVALMARFTPIPGTDLQQPETRQKFINSIWLGQNPLYFEVNFPGLKPREINARVKPTATTFVDLTLSK
jgi:hypothetical protein